MPRKKSYWKNPEKYRKERKEYYYSHNEYVPRKTKKDQNNTLGTSKTTNNKKIKSKSLVDLDIVKKALDKYYSSGYASKKVSKMHELGQVFVCQKYAFMPLSLYLDGYENKPPTTIKNSHWIGEQGTLRLIKNYIRRWFPSPRYMIYLNPVDQRGVDFLITKDAIPYAVIELTNYKQSGYLNSSDIKRYIENLNYWTKFYPNIHKVIIVNHPENLKNNPYWKDAYEAFVSEKIGIKILR